MMYEIIRQICGRKTKIQKWRLMFEICLIENNLKINLDNDYNWNDNWVELGIKRSDIGRDEMWGEGRGSYIFVRFQLQFKKGI